MNGVGIRFLVIVAAVAAIALAMFLPFLPGKFDALALPISGMAQMAGIFGLLLVPVGALWVASLHWGRLAGRRLGIAIAALVVSIIVGLLTAIGALAAEGILLTFGAIAVVVVGTWRAIPRLKSLANATTGLAGAIPYALLIVPIAVATLQWTLSGRAADFSRRRAVEQSRTLIADIERYRVERGRYPESLLSEVEDYHPGLIGIPRFHYEPSGQAYNLVFEQATFQFGTREFVAYNPRDEQVVTTHNADLLRRPLEDLNRMRGFHAVHDGPEPHWKIFLFD